MRVLIILFLCVISFCFSRLLKPSKPPRGWNSYDCFRVPNETITFVIAQHMIDTLLPSKNGGFNYLTLDEGWFGSKPVIDSYGRPIADRKLFPGSKEGSLKYIADKLHSNGLKFGLWYMGGIPKRAVEENTPILGTNFTAQQIALNQTYCPRWKKNWGYQVNHSHPGTLAWYQSLVGLWSEWNVDMIKLDCVHAEDESWLHYLDIVTLSRCFDDIPRDFLFSLSPGGFSNVSQLLSIRPFVSMARVTDDFWDTWELYMNEGGGDGWHSGESHWDAARDLVATVLNQDPTFWIDLDMLPVGRIGHPGEPCKDHGPGCPRHTRYSKSEQMSILTLWALVQSPLVVGADLTVIDSWTASLLSNQNILGMTEDIRSAWETIRRNSTSNGKYIIWQATSKTMALEIRYVAIFNLRDISQTVSVQWNDLGIYPTGNNVMDLWNSEEVHVSNSNMKVTLDPHGVILVAVPLE